MSENQITKQVENLNSTTDKSKIDNIMDSPYNRNGVFSTGGAPRGNAERVKWSPKDILWPNLL